MIRWKDWPNPKLDFLVHGGLAGACSETGLRVKLCRACEYVINCSNLQLIPNLEWVGRVYVAADWRAGDYTAEATPMNRRPTWVTFRACYESTGKRRIPDDLYQAECSLMDASKTSIYSPDRSEYAARLVRLTAECWKESWELFHQATWGTKHRLQWWPVRLWAHREPGAAFELEEDGRLSPIPGGLSAAEAALVDF